jgi:hypothetical protein
MFLFLLQYTKYCFEEKRREPFFKKNPIVLPDWSFRKEGGRFGELSLVQGRMEGWKEGNVFVYSLRDDGFMYKFKYVNILYTYLSTMFRSLIMKTKQNLFYI